ncbi:MAG: peptidyl-prolyl cis-trans isomerase [Gammaproteobacteria bacterium]|nr:MAG: peptidyl-prolyl cis-trans isomerase [Gammaproteobacteria bacterium]
MKSWIREPLLHFLVAGGVLFAIYGWINPEKDRSPQVVHISATDVNWLKETWLRQWQRPPSEQELRGLVAGYLKEELLSREAKKLGLDENDTVIRRRLAQKMEFLLQDTARVAEPDEDVLRQFHKAHGDQFQTPERITFRQLYFGDEEAARYALSELAEHHSDSLGEPSLLARDYVMADEQTVASALGPDLADRIFALAPGRWHGPLASDYGFHLVWVDARQAGQVRPFEQVRAQVLEEWHHRQQAEAIEQFFDELLKKYEVFVEGDLKSPIAPLPVALQ